MKGQRIEVWYRPGVFDAHGAAVLRDIRDLGVAGVEQAETGVVYLLAGPVGRREKAVIARELLTDPVTQRSFLKRRPKPPGMVSVEVFFRPGVTDTAGETALKAIRDLGLPSVGAVTTGRRYLLGGAGLDRAVAARICARLLANEVIQAWRIN